MYNDTLKGAGAADSRKEVEFEVELQGSRVEPTMDPHTGENPVNEDEEQDEGPQQQNLDNYVLVRDKAKRTTTIPTRMILSLTACEDYELKQLDVKMAFLHGNLEETIYIRQPPCFEEGTGYKVYLLKKSLYGLKHSQRQWYKRLRLNIPRDYYEKEFDMKELGLARKILGMEIVRDRGSQTLKVSQPGYVQKILNNYRVDNGKSASMPLGAHFKVYLKDCPSSEWNVERMSKVPYANTIGSLMYLMVCTRTDIGYVVSIVSRSSVWSIREAEYMALTEAVKESIWLKGLLIELGVNLREIVESKEIEVAKIGTKDNAADAFTKVVQVRSSSIAWRYLVSGLTSLVTKVEIVILCLVYGRDQGKHVDVDSFVDADYAKDLTRLEAVKERIWLKGLLIELGVNLRSVVVNCENQGAIHLSRNAMFHERIKHINVRCYFIREIIESKEIEVAKIGTKDNAADVFTKVVPGSKFKYCMEILGVGIN
ncbi:retrotransposon protein, putative, ty1-copia subclass [Tanacetum coccineum]